MTAIYPLLTVGLSYLERDGPPTSIKKVVSLLKSRKSLLNEDENQAQGYQNETRPASGLQEYATELETEETGKVKQALDAIVLRLDQMDDAQNMTEQIRVDTKEVLKSVKVLQTSLEKNAEELKVIKEKQDYLTDKIINCSKEGNSDTGTVKSFESCLDALNQGHRTSGLYTLRWKYIVSVIILAYFLSG